MKQRVQYEERTGWAPWVHALISICYVAVAIPLWAYLKGEVGVEPGSMHPAEAILCLLLGLGIPALVYALFGQLRVRVTDRGVHVAWGWTEIIRKSIPFEKIQKAEPVTYSPLKEFGGWGIRMGRGKKVAWTVRGNRALLLCLQSGTRFYLGSTRPERLLLRVQTAGKGKMGEGSDANQRSDK